MPSIACQRRRRLGFTKSSRQASAAPPEASQDAPGCLGDASAALDAPVVLMVRVAVPAVAPVMLTGLLEPKLSVGGSCAPEGLDVMEAASATLPVNPPAGVTVTIDVFPEVAPAETETAVPLIMKLDATAVVTVTADEVPVALVYAAALPASGV